MKLFNRIQRNVAFTVFCAVFCIIYILQIQGCKPDVKVDRSTTRSDSSTLVDAGENVQKLLNADFEILFIRNYDTKPDSNQLQKLLAQGATKPKKIVFQFFHNAKNKLTLAANAGGQNHKDFDKYTFVPTLENSNQYPATKIDITGKNVFLADQEISKATGSERDLLKELNDLVNMPDYEYITFSPRLAPGSVSGHFYVVYDIGRWKKADFRKDAFTAIEPTPIISLSLNPSPPKNGY